MDITLIRIVEELKIQQKKKTDLTEHLGMVNSAFGNWIAGRNKSYLKYLHGIADFLNVSVEYLRGETDEKKKLPTTESEELTNEKRLLLALFDQIPKEKQSDAINKLLEVLNNP